MIDVITRDELADLVADPPSLGLSLFMPTHVRGPQTRQDPIRLKNLLGRARERLLASGLSAREADDFLQPAHELVGETDFWRNQHEGLALYLDHAGLRTVQVPFALEEQVVVGPGFHTKPLLPALTTDGSFRVVTVTADGVRLYDGTRFGLRQVPAPELPGGVEEFGQEPDYQNPLQASPIGRPHTGSASITKAQVYGESPAEWRKSRLVEFTRAVAADLTRLATTDPRPVVLVADAEIGGHIRKFSQSTPPLAGVLEANPDAWDERELHAAAYDSVRPLLDAGRADAVERYRVLAGHDDPRATTEVEDIAVAAFEGRVESLLLASDQPIWGRYEGGGRAVTGAASAESGEDLLDAAVGQTLRHGGAVHLVDPEATSDRPVAAILRY